jgi:dTMP kinase
MNSNIFERVQGGLFVAVEGPDGSGKTTLAHDLVSAMNAAGKAARYQCQPSFGNCGITLRSIMRGSAMKPPAKEVAALFATDRMEHLSSEIFPLLAQGNIVVCDRYIHSSYAYQGGVDGVPSNMIRHLNRHAPRPDVTLILMADAKVCLSRIAKRDAQDDYEREAAFHKAHAYYANIKCDDSEFMLDGTMAMHAMVQRAMLIIGNVQARARLDAIGET